MEQQTWTREQVREVLNQLAKLPDFDCLPLPQNISQEYKIPMTPAKVISLQEYLDTRRKAAFVHVDKYEVRESDGKVREVPETQSSSH